MAAAPYKPPGVLRSSFGLPVISLILGVLGGAITFGAGVFKSHRDTENLNRARGISRRIITLEVMSRIARSDSALASCAEVDALPVALALLTDANREGLIPETREKRTSELIVQMSGLTKSLQKRILLDRAILRAAELERRLTHDARRPLPPATRVERCRSYRSLLRSLCGEVGRVDDGAYAGVDAVYQSPACKQSALE